jgi:nucleoside-diphosphate-sugar epimerase
LLDQPVDDARDAELSDPAIRLGDFHPFDRPRLIGSIEQSGPDVWPMLTQVTFGGIDGHPIDARAALVASNAFPRVFEISPVAHLSIDNLYQLGPRTEARHEDMPLSSASNKAAILTEATNIWMAARGRVRFAALRCPDFYGPGVVVSHIGDNAFGNLARGKAALLVAPPDTPHDFAYAPDIARAAVAFFDAPDDAFAQVWNVPCAPTRTPRELLKMGAKATGAPLRISAIPLWLLPLAGVFSRFLKEVWDVRFTWDRPYIVDSGKFTRRFGMTATPFEVGIPATARTFAAAETGGKS